MKQIVLKYGICLFLLLLQAGISFSWQEIKKDAPVIFTVAEQMPTFPGGPDALNKYIQKHLHYPKAAMKNAVHGKVVVRFIVEKDGSVTHAEIIRSLDEECDREALRVINGMPKWDQGMQGGNFVAVYYNLPITFAMY